ncbi:MAG: hypothetical protein ACYSW8_25610 [Planctomycetota bacterium]|jgi:hypothetical protein
MFGPPWLKIAGPIFLIAAIFGAGWTVNGWRMGKANVKLKGEITELELREDQFRETISECQLNREAFETRFDEIAADVNTIASNGIRMQGAIDAASIRTKEIAEAREKLAQLELEHAALVERAIPLNACQTFEMVLAAIAGGPHEQ